MPVEGREQGPLSQRSKDDRAAIERVFILRSRVGKNIYVLRKDTLEVSWRLLGRRAEARIPIRSISPEYEIRGVRHLRAVVILLLPVAACVVALRLLARVPGGPEALNWMPLEIGAVFALAAIRFYPRFEWFEFKNHFGRVVFTILREPGQREECEAFIHALLDHIEAADAGVALPPLLRSGDDAIETSNVIPRWQLAIGLSLFAIIVPVVAYFAGEHSDIAIIGPVMIGTGGSVCATFYSYARKEPRRRWALIAAIASLFPLFFY